MPPQAHEKVQLMVPGRTICVQVVLAIQAQLNLQLIVTPMPDHGGILGGPPCSHLARHEATVEDGDPKGLARRLLAGLKLFGAAQQLPPVFHPTKLIINVLEPREGVIPKTTTSTQKPNHIWALAAGGEARQDFGLVKLVKFGSIAVRNMRKHGLEHRLTHPSACHDSSNLQLLLAGVRCRAAHHTWLLIMAENDHAGRTQGLGSLNLAVEGAFAPRHKGEGTFQVLAEGWPGWHFWVL
mmetsp:Transcript_65558/g.154144  ORF Transcript_65558/g.154144 Transcript_65558/m.154144 type:complete len:239 (-) Transcript_65558:999-1715(-)